MGHKGQQPNQIALNMVAAACGRCLKWAVSLRATLSDSADVVMLNTAARCCCAASAWAKGLSSISSAPWRRVQPDIVSYNTLLGSGATFGGSWLRTLSLLAACRGSDATTYTSSMSTVGASTCWQAGAGLLCDFLCKGLQSDQVMMSAMISTCSVSTKWPFAMHVLDLCVTRALRSDTIEFGACLNGCSLGQKWSQAIQLLGLLGQKDLESSQVADNSVLSACQSLGRWQMSITMLCAVQPDLITMNTVLAACDKAHQWKRASELLQQAAAVELQADSILRSVAIGSCQRTRQWRPALGMFSTGGLRPCIAMCNEVIAACSGPTRWPLALHLLHELPGSELSPNEVTCGACLDSLTEAGIQWRFTVALLNTFLSSTRYAAARRALPQCSEAWCTTARAVGTEAAWAVALGIQSDMRRLGGEPDATMLAEVAVACERGASEGPMHLLLDSVALQASLALRARD
ncbi:unnamed protein product [Effrenium voratum]|nr:unnamed protein product [Effrenium voratum]